MIRQMLVIAPHADDETIACGGTIAKKINQGYKVNIIVVTKGEKSHTKVDSIKLKTEELLPEIREKECVSACLKLGIKSENITFFRLNDGEVDSEIENLSELLADYFSKYKDLNQLEYYFPHPLDFHPDHKTVGQVMLNWLQKMEKLPSFFMYRVYVSVTKKIPGKTIKEDITDFLTLKKEALSTYSSQVSTFFENQSKAILSEDFLTPHVDTTFEEFYVLK